MTLVEVVLTLSIMAILMSAFFPQLKNINNSWDTRRGHAEYVQNARVLADHIQNNLSKAVRITAVSGDDEQSGFIQYLARDGSEYRYEVNGQGYVLFGEVTGAGSGSLNELAGPVQALEFKCYRIDDLEHTDHSEPELIRVVKGSLTISNPAKTSHQRTYEISSFLQTNGDPNPPYVSPSAYWKLDDPWPIIAIDSAGSNHGWYLSGCQTWYAGVFGASVFFEDEAHIYINHSDDFFVSSGTICFWIYSLENNGRGEVFSKDATGYLDGGHLALYLDSHRKFKARMQSKTKSYTLDTGTNTIFKNRWYHIAYTFGPRGMQLFVNGELEDSDDYDGGLDQSCGGDGNTEPIAIGACTWGSNEGTIYPLTNNYYWWGLIDEVAFYPVQLSDTQIITVMDEGVKDMVQVEP